MPRSPTTRACRTAWASRSARPRMSRPTNIPANNATYTFLRRPTPSSSSRAAKSSTTTPATPVTTICFPRRRALRPQYCAMCHESYSFDAQSGNSLDLKVMIHKIHAGETLPSVEAGGFYGIFGFGNTFTDLGEVVYPQDKRNCSTCHQESDTDTPQASNWRLTVNRRVLLVRATTTSTSRRVRITAAWRRRPTPAAPATARRRRCAGELRAGNAHRIPESCGREAFMFEVRQGPKPRARWFPRRTLARRSDQGGKVLPGEIRGHRQGQRPGDGTAYRLTDARLTNVSRARRGHRNDLQRDTARLRSRVAYTTIDSRTRQRQHAGAADPIDSQGHTAVAATRRSLAARSGQARREGIAGGAIGGRVGLARRPHGTGREQCRDGGVRETCR